MAGGKKSAILRNKTRRGRWRKYKGVGQLKLSLFGNNSNGLKAKMKSLRAAITIFDKPSCITIQETKLRQANFVKLDGYTVFEKQRVGLGGGLLTAIAEDLDPVLVSDGGEENEILVVQAKLGNIK